MTTVKCEKRGRATAVMIALFVVIITVCSGCSAKDEPLPDFLPSFDSEDAAESMTAAADRILLILPSDAGSLLYQKAEALGEALKGQTGLPWRTVTDRESVALSSGDFRVVIGWAEHPDSSEHLKSLRQEEYLCAGSARSLVLASKTEEGAVQAIDRFLSEYLPYVSPRALMRSGDGFRHEISAVAESVALNDTPIYDWCVVCESLELTVFARRLQTEIEANSGYRPEILNSDREAEGRPILFLALNPSGADHEARLKPVDGGILLEGDQLFSLSVAVDSFLELLFSEADDGLLSSHLEAEHIIPVEKHHFELRLVVSRLYDGTASLDHITKFTDEIQRSSAEGVYFSPMTDLTERYIREILSGTYEFLNASEGLVLGKDGTRSAGTDETLADGICGLYEVGTERGGFLWVVARAEADLSDWIEEADRPVIVTVIGEAKGIEDLDHVFSQTVTADGTELLCQCYATPNMFDIAIEIESGVAGDWALSIERIQ